MWLSVSSNKLKYLVKGACWLVIAAGLFVRFWLWNIPYEYDELFTAITANPKVPFGWIWQHYLVVDVHPPLFNFLLWLWNHFVPYGPEIWLRLPSLLMGLGGLWVCWHFFPARFGRLCKLVFITLLSGSFYLCLYAPHARAYSLQFLLGSLFLFLLLDFSRRLRLNVAVSNKQILCYGLLGIFLSWSHYFGALTFFVGAILLFFQALHYRRPYGKFLLIPLCVFLLFLPWLVPNFLFNWSASRFNGSWWAEQVMSWQSVLPEWSVFFFNSPYGHMAMALLVLGGIGDLWHGYQRTGRVPFFRDLGLILALLAGVFGIACVLSIKIFLLFGRYFMPVFPAVYLGCVLLSFRVIQRTVWAKVVFLLYLGISVYAGVENSRILKETNFFPTRAAAQFYRDYASHKELFVISMEAFPPASMEAMYGFYPNQVYHMNAKVTELYQLPRETRNKLLSRRKNAIIWMPICEMEKLTRLSQEWQRPVGIEGPLGRSCFLQVGEENQFDNVHFEHK